MEVLRIKIIQVIKKMKVKIIKSKIMIRKKSLIVEIMEQIKIMAAQTITLTWIIVIRTTAIKTITT